MTQGRAKSRCSGATSLSPLGAGRRRGAPRSFSKMASSAGTRAKVKTQQSSIPIPPMKPKCRKPRLAAMIRTPKDTLVAAEASRVARAVVTAPSTQEADRPSPPDRNCLTRAR